MATTKMNQALETGLLIADRISNAGLRWIRNQDEDLFNMIMSRRSGKLVRRKR